MCFSKKLSSAKSICSPAVIFFHRVIHTSKPPLQGLTVHPKYPHNRDEIRFANLALISGRQMYIRASTMSIFLVAITKNRTMTGCNNMSSSDFYTFPISYCLKIIILFSKQKINVYQIQHKTKKSCNLNVGVNSTNFNATPNSWCQCSDAFAYCAKNRKTFGISSLEQRCQKHN